MIKEQIPDIGSVASTELQPSISRKLLFEDDNAYHAARKVWNGMIDKRPAFIVQCSETAEVVSAVKFARHHNIKISVRGGGHNIAGNAVCDQGMMIDLSPMKAISVDPAKKTARAQGGVLWRELDAATQKYNLATTGGTISDTGIGGLTLGGGLGWLMGKHGATCDNVLSAELITADGALLKVDQDNYPDLFWAIRGGGGNFGIVTQFEYRLHDVSTVFGGMLLYTMDKAKEVFQFYREFVKDAPDELMSYSGFIVTPDGVPVTMLCPVWVGNTEEGARRLAQLRTFITPIADMVGEMPYVQIQSLLDAAAPTGIRRYWKSGYFTELSDELLDIVIANVALRPSPLSPVLFFHIHGEAARVSPDATAFVHRKNQWDSDIIAQWIEPANDEINISWTRKFWKEVEPLTNGVYVNHLDKDDSGRIKNAYADNYKRLQQIKAKYDPGNFFNLNNNIVPATQATD